MNLRRFQATLLLGSLALSSCHAYTPIEKPFLQRPDEFENRRIPLLPSQGKLSQDLDSLSFAALEVNSDIKVASASVVTSLSAVETAGETPNPTLSFSPQYISNPAGLPLWAIGASLDLLVETKGKKGLRVKQAESLSKIAKLQVIQTAWQVRKKVRDSFIALYRARALEELLNEEQKALKSNKTLLNERAAGGQLSGLIAIDAESSLRRADLAVLDVRQASVSAINGLSGTIGVPSETLKSADFNFASIRVLPSYTNNQLIELKKSALVNRADLQAAIESFEGAHMALQSEIAKVYPDLHIAPDFTWDQGANKWGLFFSGVLPIFNQNEGAIHEAEGKRQEMALKFASLQDQIISEFDLASSEYAASLQKLKAAGDGLEGQIKQHESLSRLLRPGDVSRPVLFKSLMAVSAAKQAKLEAFTQAQLALGQLEDASQIFMFQSDRTFSSLSENPVIDSSHEKIKERDVTIAN